MKKSSVSIPALVIFSAIMLVILWGIFSAAALPYLEFSISSENVKSFVSFTSLIREGWAKGSAKQNFRMSVSGNQDAYAIGIINEEFAHQIKSMNLCVSPSQKYCIKQNSKDIIQKCDNASDLCVCLFRLKYSYSYCTPPLLNVIYSAELLSGTSMTDELAGIDTWDSDFMDTVMPKLDRLDVVMCQKMREDLKCSSGTNPCVLAYKESGFEFPDYNVFVWIQAPMKYSTITMDRKFDGSTPLGYMIIKTYPDSLVNAAMPFGTC